MNNRIEQVKSVFAQPERYLKDDFMLRIRAEVVAAFVGEQVFRSILDIGCGNGAISLPLLQQETQLALLDFSSNMLALARPRIPAEFSANVEFINDDFMSVQLPPHSYDLILCLGVLAHIDSPRDAIAKMVSLLQPGGSIIVQNTDAQHPVSYLFHLYSRLRNVLLPAPYPLNQLPSATVVEMFRTHGLQLAAVYRHNAPLPGMTRVLTSKMIYQMIRKVYGIPPTNYRSWSGSECIYHFGKLGTGYGKTVPGG